MVFALLFVRHHLESRDLVARLASIAYANRLHHRRGRRQCVDARPRRQWVLTLPMAVLLSDSLYWLLSHI